MDKGVLYFQRVRPDLDFMNEVFTFDVRRLPQTDAMKISQYCIGLSQFVVYMRSEMNKTLSEITMKNRFIESTVNLLMTNDLIKTYKTKSAAHDYVVSNSTELTKLKEDVDELKKELVLLEGQDKKLAELVASFKRELSRRENELYYTRMERHG
jgi:hypothetical protein